MRFLTPLPTTSACLLTLTLLLQGMATADEPGSVPPDHPERAKRGLALFKGSVREILTKHCLDCHGGKSVKSDFDLSTRESLMESGFVGRTAADSHLMALVTHDAEPHMPWKEPKLDEAQIQAIGQWIDFGAPYDAPMGKGKEGPAVEMQVTEDDRNFWSFRPLQAPVVPEVTDQEWCRTPIDHFIRAKQEAAGLVPNGEAARRVLIRRASFDLTGLPPSPADVEAFVKDESPDAWSRLLDRLLDSPQYGERWARHWMDVARFAESHGYEQDYDRPHAYHYRDFLIRALNEDLPYDKFVHRQLAGDELAPENPLAMMATGFLGAGAFPTQLTEAEFESARYDELDDMVMTTGVSFLGLSVGCARCHDHKFDPIPARDYYSMAATFSTAIRSETRLDLAPAINARRREEFEKRLAELRSEVATYQQQTLPGQLEQWLKDHPEADTTGPWEPLHVVSVKSSAGTTFETQPDGSVLSTGAAPGREVITLEVESRRPNVAALRLEALTHASLPQNGPGRAPNGNFALGDIRLQRATETEGAAEPLAWKQARTTHQQNADTLSVAASIDADPISGWAVDAGGIGKDQAAVFDLQTPQALTGTSRWIITLTLNHPNPQHTLGRFRLSFTDRADAVAEVGVTGPDSRIVKALQAVRQSADRTSDDWKVALEWFAGQDPRMQELQKALTAHEQQGAGLEMTTVMVTSEGLPHLSHHADDRGFPHFYPDTYLLKRGDVHQKQEQVQAGFLQVLNPTGADPAQWRPSIPTGWTRTSFRRASMAHWITDTDRGAGSLAARVMANRLWQHHFGRGIVATPNDFGISGERPSHPELLEWLASELVSGGWKLKRMHKLIMSSQVWMQDGAFDEARAAIDRENMLLWRRAPKRLEAEAIRDSMLSVSGQLNLTPFGPGTLDQNMKRRSVYFFIKRSQLIPVMMLFDWPEHLVSIGQRPVTTIAPQALMFMNSPQGRSYAEAFAARLPGGNVEQAINDAWQLAFGRPPAENETSMALKFLEEQAADPNRQSPAGTQQSLSDLCQTLLSMNEFVYVE